MPKLKSVLGSCPFTFLIYTILSATGAAFIPLLISLRSVISNYFDTTHFHLPRTTYLTAIIAAAVVSFFICFMKIEKHRDYICCIAIALIPPIYTFSLLSILFYKSTSLTYLIAISLGGALFGVISTTAISSVSSINPISTTAFIFGLQLANFTISIVYHYISSGNAVHGKAKLSEILYKTHTFPIWAGLLFSVIFIIFIKSSTISDIQKKNNRVDDGSNLNSFLELVKDLKNTYIASGLVAFSILIESSFFPTIIPHALEILYDKTLSIIFLNSFYSLLGAFISGIIPLSHKSGVFKFILWPLNLLRIPVLLIAAQTRLFEVTPMYISSAVIFSGILHGYSVGSSFIIISDLTQKNKSQAYAFNSFIFLFFMAIGAAISFSYIELTS